MICFLGFFFGLFSAGLRFLDEFRRDDSGIVLGHLLLVFSVLILLVVLDIVVKVDDVQAHAADHSFEDQSVLI